MTYEFEIITYLGFCYQPNLKEKLNELGKEGFGVVGTLLDETDNKNVIILQKQID